MLGIFEETIGLTKGNTLFDHSIDISTGPLTNPHIASDVTTNKALSMKLSFKLKKQP